MGHGDDHTAGERASRTAADWGALRVFPEWCVRYPWWDGLLNREGLWLPREPENGPLDEPTLRRELGFSRELIQAGREYNAVWERWAQADMDADPALHDPALDSPAARAWRRDQNREEARFRRIGQEVVRRTLIEAPVLWIMDEDGAWHRGAEAPELSADPNSGGLRRGPQTACNPLGPAPLREWGTQDDAG